MRKLRHGAKLTEEDERRLMRLETPAHRMERRGDIVFEGSGQQAIVLLLDGWACDYEQLENGKRQIVSLLVPGDLSDAFGREGYARHRSLGAISSCLFAPLPQGALRQAAEESPRIEQALWWDVLDSDAMVRERVVSVGRRSAIERLGHTFCELHLRLTRVGLADEPAYDLPLTQADLADLLGVTDVHVNRSLQELRRLGLLSLRGRRLTIHDLDALREIAMFDPAYLEGGRA